MANQRTVLVTGATSGIGLIIANKLHDKGFKVFGTGRHPDKHKVAFELLPLDVTSDESIKKCIEVLLTKTQALDVLINNAGSSLGGTIEETPVEQARKLFETNFWGVVKMTKAVLPLMREQRRGRIITIGSFYGLIGAPVVGYYSASKHALEGFFKSLRPEVKQFNIKVSVIEPSFYKTSIGAAGERTASTIPDYDKIRKPVLEFVGKSLAGAPTPEPVAELVLKIINTKEPKFSYPIGKNARFLPALQFLSPAIFESRYLKMLKL
jgi:short-subunit dehydrogenase